MEESNNSKSFAERFAKKSSFTTESLAKKDIQSKDQSAEKSIEDALQTKNNSTPKKVDPIKKSMSDLVYLVKGVDDNRNAWYYVLVERMKVNLFLKALNDDIIHLEKYGKILYSAYGDEPPKEITDAVKEEYGIS